MYLPVIILSAFALSVFLWVGIDVYKYHREIKKDEKKRQFIDSIIDLDEFERKLSDDPTRLIPMHPKDWESFANLQGNNINA